MSIFSRSPLVVLPRMCCQVYWCFCDLRNTPRVHFIEPLTARLCVLRSGIVHPGRFRRRCLARITGTDYHAGAVLLFPYLGKKLVYGPLSQLAPRLVPNKNYVSPGEQHAVVYFTKRVVNKIGAEVCELGPASIHVTSLLLLLLLSLEMMVICLRQ